MKQTKIDWCDSTINPVVGCPRNCPYCYAKKLNTRFKWIPDFSKPEFFPERLKQFESKKPKSIFMDSMSDIAFWAAEWIGEVLAAIRTNPQHNYIFLTKGNALRYNFFYDRTFTESNNLFFGKTITKSNQIAFTDSFNFDFLSIEPILESLTLDIRKNKELKQIIIGAETGNRKGKVIPEKKWIDNIVRQADEHGIKVFMKESLRQLMGKDFRQDRLIWEV